MKERCFHILLALADHERHGLEIRRAVEESTSGRIRLWPGTLYGTLEELAQGRWIEEVAAPPDARRDGDPKFFRITAMGRTELRSEISFLEAVLQRAKAKAGLS